ncbi:hypothetical protein Y88_1770 [Novosphingobium nitrogenifigens DSM 19370]|uniref:DUF4238 domain-containing protein n=1 Tax=Novosphingobium nitrogenifigens DSM 19370 TaxID=983920 RepID=F1Z3Y7_9SPHN|nr:DUF4238 domain-containing protein [Novosphingobium nitrogenifigens]EGD60689.1 hypothetical protein Y88_1770 [Novosphingobium nitrogenifigens DSM 19370]
MSDPDRHHFLPRFYLARWRHAEGKVVTYSRQRGRLYVRDYAPKEIGAQRGLYALKGAPAGQRNALERDFMGPEVDDPASQALRLLLSETPVDLPMDMRQSWVRFLMSLFVRLPVQLADIRADAARTLREEFAAKLEEYEAIRRPGDPESFLEWIETKDPGHLFEDFGTSLIPDMIAIPNMNHDIMGMDWRVCHFKDGPYGFLTCDFPICMLPGLAHPDCLISLPLSPTAVFLAAYNSDLLDRLTVLQPPTLIDAVNRLSISSAQDYVYADSRYHHELIDRLLRRS